MMHVIVSYLLVAGGLIIGLGALGVDVFAHMMQYPHLEMLVMPLKALIGIAAVVKIIRNIAGHHCMHDYCAGEKK